MSGNIFQTAFVVGGEIGVTDLPHPQFPKFTMPLVKGRKIDVLAQSRIFQDVVQFPFDVEMVNISMSCSAYSDGDYWELIIGDRKICETIYTKQLPEAISMGNSLSVIFPILANTPIKFDYYNVSGQPKSVFYNVKVLTA